MSISAPMPGDELGDGTVGLRGGELVVGVGHLDVRHPAADHRRLGLREPGHRRAEHAQQPVGAVLAHRRLEREPGRQGVDVGLAQRGNIGTGDGQAEQSPCPCDLVGRYPEFLGRGLQRVDRRPRPGQNITGEAEQPAALLGLDHLLGSEAQIVQVLDQVGPLARIGDPGRLQRIEVQVIGHLPKSASSGPD